MSITADDLEIDEEYRIDITDREGIKINLYNDLYKFKNIISKQLLYKIVEFKNIETGLLCVLFYSNKTASFTTLTGDIPPGRCNIYELTNEFILK